MELQEKVIVRESSIDLVNCMLNTISIFLTWKLLKFYLKTSKNASLKDYLHIFFLKNDEGIPYNN